MSSTASDRPVARTVGDQLALLRERQGLTRQELAERLGVHPRQVADIETALTKS